jgi:hypothetical protein
MVHDVGFGASGLLMKRLGVQDVGIIYEGFR